MEKRQAGGRGLAMRRELIAHEGEGGGAYARVEKWPRSEEETVAALFGDRIRTAKQLNRTSGRILAEARAHPVTVVTEGEDAVFRRALPPLPPGSPPPRYHTPEVAALLRRGGAGRGGDVRALEERDALGDDPCVAPAVAHEDQLEAVERRCADL